MARLALAAGAPQSLTDQDTAQTLPTYKCGVEDGTFMDPDQCDMYWTCEGGRSTNHLCDDGLVFDRFNGLAGHADPCDSPLRVNCSGRPYLQEPTYPTPECVRRHGVFEDADPTVCNRFHVCKAGYVEET
ncbi:chitin binding peritrophin-A domain-containing protein, partial [Salmonella sp. s55033]|uniref:chitin binding peritrophin-A domain-containing protein n=1 Tax=Salmonella sp. s55033 TaxID=3159676 RepID=UPI003980C036